MSEIKVISVSSEEVEHGVAELWAARSLANALAEADRLLSLRKGEGPANRRTQEKGTP